MPEQVLTDVGIWISGHDFAGTSNSFSFERSADTPEKTNFKSGRDREYAAGGPKSSTFSLEGFYDAEETDEAQFTGLASARSALVVPAGQSPGDVAHIYPMVKSAYGQSGGYGEIYSMSLASQGSGTPVHAQILDIRDEVTALNNTERRQLGAIPAGETLHLWAHVAREAGELELELLSVDAAIGGTITSRTMRSSITETGLYPLTVDGPETAEYWFVRYSPSGASPSFDVAIATFFASQNLVAIPITPPITPPPIGTVTIKGGLSVDDTPQGSEITIDGVNHVVSFAPFSNRHVLIWRIATQPDLTSIVLSTDPTRANMIGGFTKFGNAVNAGGQAGNVWVSNQSLTFAVATDVETG